MLPLRFVRWPSVFPVSLFFLFCVFMLFAFEASLFVVFDVSLWQKVTLPKQEGRLSEDLCSVRSAFGLRRPREAASGTIAMHCGGIRLTRSLPPRSGHRCRCRSATAFLMAS